MTTQFYEKQEWRRFWAALDRLGLIQGNDYEIDSDCTDNGDILWMSFESTSDNADVIFELYRGQS